MACQILNEKRLLSFRVLTEDKVVYVLYDVDSDSMKFFLDENYRTPCGLWAWQEKEVVDMVRKHLTVPTASVA